MNKTQITARHAELTAEAGEILDRSDGPLTDDERSRLTAIESELEDLKVRRQAAANFAAGAFEAGDGTATRNGPEVLHRRDPWAGGDLARADGPDLRSRAATAVERMAGDHAAKVAATEVLERNGSAVARHILTASAPDYVSAFEKVVRSPNPERAHLEWTPAEAEAYRSVQALERIGSVGTDAAGGFLVPTHLDPSIILSSAGSASPFRQIARVVQLGEGTTWNGVTSAGVTLSWDTEGSEVSDDSPTLGRAGIPVHKMAGFVGASFELIDDAPGLGSEVVRLFTDAADQAEATAFVSGSGTNQPTGIVTALAAETSRWSTHATNSAFTSTDLLRTQEHLGSRWQRRASWVGSLTYLNRVRGMGDTNYFGRTVTLDAGVSESILGRNAYEASTMSTALNTSTNSAFVYGDWNEYVIVDRLGARVSFVPHLFGASQRPTGQAGWYLMKRTGAEPTTTTSFVLSVNPGA